MLPDPAKSLLSNVNGEEVVEVNSDTLGLKSKVSDDLIFSPNTGISFLYLSLS